MNMALANGGFLHYMDMKKFLKKSSSLKPLVRFLNNFWGMFLVWSFSKIVCKILIHPQGSAQDVPLRRLRKKMAEGTRKPKEMGPRSCGIFSSTGRRPASLCHGLSVCALTFSLNIFFSETTYRILMKFHRNVLAIVLFRIFWKNLIPSETRVAIATKLKKKNEIFENLLVRSHKA